MDRIEYDRLVASLSGGGAPTPDLGTFTSAWEFDSNFVWRIPEGHTHNALEAALEEVERLTETNDRLARIASQVSVALEEGKRDFMAHGWEVGYGQGFSDATWRKGHNSDTEHNPYRGKSERLEGLEGL